MSGNKRPFITLLARTGKNEVRVTPRAVEILYPDTPASRVAALMEAAKEPELFQRIMDRFTDGLPSQGALEAFLIRQGFTHTAVPAATRAFLETFLFLENAIGSESYSQRPETVVEPQSIQQVERSPQMNIAQLPPPRVDKLQGAQEPTPQPFEVSIRQKMIWLSGTIRDHGEADDVIKAINGLRSMLPAKPESPERVAISDQSKADDPDS